MRDPDKDTGRAAELIELLVDDATDPATQELIRAWFWSGVSKKAKDVAVIERFRQMAPNIAPDESDHKKYEELAARLNINGTTRTVKRESPPTSFLSAPMRIAASVVLLLGLSGLAYFWFDRAGEHRLAEVTVSAGSSSRSIELPDGSSIELGANSELTYDENFTSGRRIHLDGEAILTVEKSTNEAGEFIPFSVITDDLEVDVYGTAFRVIDPDDDIDHQSIVTLYDGSVSVASNDGVVTLKPGEEYCYDHVAQKPNVALILAREMIEHGFMPLLRFEDSSLGNVVTSLTANYGVEFVMPDDVDLSKGKFSGDFHAEDLRSTLNILTKMSPRLNFILMGNDVVVKRKINPNRSWQQSDTG